MLTRNQEKKFYLLSERLGIELYLVGVGNKQFLPEQDGHGAGVETKSGALADWVHACLIERSERPWWVHTHPGFDPYFSGTDVEGAHRLYDVIRRPIDATVLGARGRRYQTQIDSRWIRTNPSRPPTANVIQPLGLSTSLGLRGGGQNVFDLLRDRFNLRGYQPQEKLADLVGDDPPDDYVMPPELELQVELDSLIDEYGEEFFWAVADQFRTRLDKPWAPVISPSVIDKKLRKGFVVNQAGLDVPYPAPTGIVRARWADGDKGPKLRPGEIVKPRFGFSKKRGGA